MSTMSVAVEAQQIDLTYITECMITLLCPAGCPEHIYLQNLQDIIAMLQSKHGHNYMIINLSQRNDTLARLNHKVVDTGWVELLAPNLNQIFSMCSLIENWLQMHSKHVLVLHCRGNKGSLGVLLASYIQFSNMAASADFSLNHFAMTRFYSDKLSSLMTPSQKRYVGMLGSLLKRELRLNPSPLFLLCVVLHGAPKLRADGGCCLFLRVYQSLQAVCTSAVYKFNAAQTDRLYFILQPPQLLQGEVMVVCYDKNQHLANRQVVFRLQFHMGFVHENTITFCKTDLDCAVEDPRFPDDGKVELLLSDSAEKIRGRELWHNGHSVTVDYDTLDPVVRRDSYQDVSPLQTDPPCGVDPGNGSFFDRLKQKSSKEAASLSLNASSPSCRDRTPSVSTDSGLSVTSNGRTTAVQRTGTPEDHSAQAQKLISGLDFEIAQPLLEVMTEFAARGAGGKVAREESRLGDTINRDASSSERETDILDDEQVTTQASEIRSSVGSLPSKNLRETQTEYSTHSWVKQQQMVDVTTHTYNVADGGERGRKDRSPPLVAPKALAQGVSSQEAVQRMPVDEDCTNNQNEDQASLADIDDSIEKLNRLILDLDPTFVPVPTRSAPLSRAASVQTNGRSHKGNNHQSGWRQEKQISDVVDYAGFQSKAMREDGAKSFRGPAFHSPPMSPNQHGRFFKADSVDYQGHTDYSDIVPPTPAFPVSPPTPYDTRLKTGTQRDKHNWTQDSRSFLDSLNHRGGVGNSTEGEVFRSEVPVTSASCQRIFGSMCSVSSESPIPHTDSTTPPLVWQDWISNPQPSPPLSLNTPKAHSSPQGALKGPGGGPGVRKETDSADLSSLLLGNGSLDHSLLEAVEGLERLNLGRHGGLPPLIPEKRRGGEGGELGSYSPSLSGFSSPRSGSTLSIPFSSPATPDPYRGVSGTSSPGADFGGKDTKFAQDTSRFWYKPDISRDQAITVLKDKEPGSFIVRDSHSFRGAYGLAMKVATPPPSVLQQSKKVGDMSNELVRHFLIECTQKGVRLKGCPNEPYFGSLTALVCQHSITPMALPCKLILPDKDPMEDLNESAAQTSTNSAAELLKQGAACNVWYLGSVALESLTGHQAVQKATTLTLAMDPLPVSTVVHFKVSAQGITLTDNQRKLFFRRHYSVNTVIFCSLDPQDRKWMRDSSSTAKIFGFVARKSQSETENMCHLFAEHDPEQPASAIVNFVSKVMIGSNKK